MTVGDKLTNLISLSKFEVILVAPFIKEGAMAKLLSFLAKDVSLTIVTRWHIEEICAGVSDLEIWSLLNKRSNTTLHLNHNLHAKYYRSDRTVLIGSANITSKALGWSKNSNLELLEHWKVEDADWQLFETKALKNSVRVTAAIFDWYKEQIELAKADQNVPIKDPINLTSWRPVSRNPEQLFDFYTDQTLDLTQVGKTNCLLDLSRFRIKAGLDKTGFYELVALELMRNEEVLALLEYGTKPRRFGEMRRFLQERECPDGAEQWQIWMRWFRTFLSERINISTPNYSEIFETL